MVYVGTRLRLCCYQMVKREHIFYGKVKRSLDTMQSQQGELNNLNFLFVYFMFSLLIFFVDTTLKPQLRQGYKTYTQPS